MKFANIKIENFLAITEAEFKLADRGLVLVQGENLDDSSADSNGSGKSSLADALCWAAYGTTARGVSGDAVINDTVGKGTMVQIDILDGDDVFRINRYRKHPKGKNALNVLHLAKDGTMTDLTKGTDKLTQEVVDKVIGASLDVFRAAVYAGQENLPDLPAMTDKSLKVLIEEAAGVTLLEDAYQVARERLTVTKSAQSEITNKIESHELRIGIKTTDIAQANIRDVDWLKARDENVAAAKVDIVTQITDVRALDAEIALIDKPAIEQEIANLDAKIASVYDEQLAIKTLTAAASTANFTARQLRTSLDATKTQHDRQKTVIADIDHKIGCPCDECGREITVAEIGAAKTAAEKQLGEIASVYAGLKKELEAAVKVAQETGQALITAEQGVTDISATTAQRALKATELSQLAAKVAARAEKAGRAKEAGERVKKLLATESPHRSTICDMQADLERAVKSLSDLKVDVKTAQNAVDIAETVVKVFSPAGVRAHILDEVTPFLNQQTNKYLTVMSDGNIEAVWTTLVKNAKGELREKFSIEVVNQKGAQSFAGLSGGEKRKVRISTALALQDLVATRATKPIELFIGDEIDDALDNAGLERLTQILEEKAQERGSVFIISHSSLRDWVSQIITVRKENGKTTLLEETV